MIDTFFKYKKMTSTIATSFFLVKYYHDEKEENLNDMSKVRLAEKGSCGIIAARIGTLSSVRGDLSNFTSF